MKNMITNEEAATAEVALKVYVFQSSPEIRADVSEGDRIMREIADSIDLTEAPEDAVCNLVIGLLHYCEREKIDWTQEVMSRAWEQFGSERADESQKQ